MEIDPMKVEKSSEQLIRWSSSSSDDQQRVDRVRLYRCTFCRRGFSNAQALGGHMNIHRKDRAKLREFSNDNNLLSLSVSEHPHRDDNNDDEEQPGSPSERPCDDHHAPKGNNNNNVLDEDPLLLPLFVETPPPAANNNGKESCCSHVELSDNGAPSASPAVDLELRLGVEPHQHDLEVINIPPPTNPGLISTSYTKQE